MMARVTKRGPRLPGARAGEVETIARYLDDPRDIQFGTGTLLRHENVYLADASGTLDYLPTPPP